MRELLIRYLLGELDPSEHQDVQRRLAASAELRQELARLRSCFATSGHADEPAEPPRGLAERTSGRIAGYDTVFDSSMSAASSPRAAGLSETIDPPAGPLGWSLADLTVAGGVILAVSMLLFPALRDSRDGTRRNVCQNNQRELWRLVSLYADKNGGYVPPVRPNENAGIFTVRLVESGLVTAEELASLLVCPDAPAADAIRSGRLRIVIPTSAQLLAMSPRELAVARRNMSPTLAYRFGYRNGSQYRYIRAEPRPLSALFSDAPGDESNGLMSPNHGGTIVQVMIQDGSIKSLTSCTVPGIDDDLYRNALGMVAAGLGRHDAVLGRSEATPGFISFESSR